MQLYSYFIVHRLVWICLFDSLYLSIKHIFHIAAPNKKPDWSPSFWPLLTHGQLFIMHQLYYAEHLSKDRCFILVPAEELRCKECGKEFKQPCKLRIHKAHFERNKKCPSWKVSLLNSLFTLSSSVYLLVGWCVGQFVGQFVGQLVHIYCLDI